MYVLGPFWQKIPCARKWAPRIVVMSVQPWIYAEWLQICTHYHNAKLFRNWRGTQIQKLRLKGYHFCRKKKTTLRPVSPKISSGMNSLSSGPTGIDQCDIFTFNHMNYNAQKSFPGISTSIPLPSMPKSPFYRVKSLNLGLFHQKTSMEWTPSHLDMLRVIQVIFLPLMA